MPLFLGTRYEDGSLRDFYGYASLGDAIRGMEERADALPATRAAWLISGDPYSQFSSVIDTRAGTRV